jgi:hypothetical protein
MQDGDVGFPTTEERSSLVRGTSVTVRANTGQLWRFAALGLLLLTTPFFVLGDGDASWRDAVLVGLAVLLSAIPWFGVVMMVTMRAEISPTTFTLHGLTMRDRSIARADLARIHAEWRANPLTHFAARHQLHVTLSGTTRAGEPIDLRLSDAILDAGHLLRALQPWIASDPSLVQDDATRDALASLRT